MAPEVVVLLINACGMVLAYGVIYPRLLPITLGKMMLADGVITAILVAISVAVFWDSGLRFWLFGWHVGSGLFALITLLIIEAPLFSWFSKRHNIKL
jgi:hypothetical protein